jgi:hypothetical protein
MRELGYRNHNSILNLGSLFLFFSVWVLKVVIMIPILYFIQKHSGKCKAFYKSQKKSIFFSEIILILIEGCMEFLISGYLNIMYPVDEENIKSGELFSKIYGIICIIKVVIILPAVYIYVLKQPIFYIKKSEKF